MISFRDMTFCSDAIECANHTTCSRWFGPLQEAACDKWWGKPGGPVMFGSFKDDCVKFIIVTEE